ncbi:MAG: class I SAM-dependent methyltransferase [archaeon]|jgi:ubiquinone biosynthesis O-methyltransferase
MESYKNIVGDYYEDAHYKSNKAQEFHYISREQYFIEFMGLKGNEKVLDIGCGSGTFSRTLAKKYPQLKIVGVDISKKAINYARKKTMSEGIKNINFCVSSIEDIKIKFNDFDVAVVSHIIEHVKNPAKAIIEVKKKLKIGGTIFLTTPNYASLWPIAEYVFDKTLAKKNYSLGEQHISKFTFFSIRNLLNENGFVVTKERALYLISMEASLISSSLAWATFKFDKLFSWLPFGMIIYLSAIKK